jgi:hypothetical protein
MRIYQSPRRVPTPMRQNYREPAESSLSPDLPISLLVVSANVP